MMYLALTAMSLALLDPTSAAEPNPATQPAPAAKRTPSPSTRYCTVETPTGSILPVRTCHTRAEWLERGVDPLVRP